MVSAPTFHDRQFIADMELRDEINASLARAVTDRAYEKLLLADPTIILSETGTTPQQYLQLRGIRAADLQDFALQALELFCGPSDPTSVRDYVPLAAGQ
jgi:hypothetical protein